jgi:hypothetical protein
MTVIDTTKLKEVKPTLSDEVIEIINQQSPGPWRWFVTVGTDLDRIEKIDYIQQSDTQTITWGFRHRLGRHRIQDFTVRQCKSTPEKKVEYCSWQCGQIPNRFAFYTSNDGELTDLWLIDLDRFCATGKVFYVPDGWQDNGDNTGFNYWKRETMQPFIIYDHHNVAGKQ